MLSKCGTGVRRLALGELGLNRAMSCQHEHDLGRMLSVQGFARFRYRQGWCHEPSGTDPLAVVQDLGSI